MSHGLLLFEDSHWRLLRPLTDLTPVPALAFGGSNLTERWRRVAGAPLIGIVARPGPLACWVEAPAPESVRLRSEEEVWIANAAALPGPWLEVARALDAPVLLRAGDRVVGARASYGTIAPGISRGAAFESFLVGLGLPEQVVQAQVLAYPWNWIEWNGEAIVQDLSREHGVCGDVDRLASILEPERVTVDPGARVDPYAVLDARSGPIRIGTGARVSAHTVVTGPCMIGPGTQLLGGFIRRSSIGPQCRIAGEVEDCVWQGYANKRHQGFVGHSLVGEWVNLGAVTTTSDLKNNYGTVRVWIEGESMDSGTTKIGSLIGPHVKTGIGTLLPTGASIGFGCNLFGGGRFVPRQLPAFSWWDGERTVTHRLDPFLATARTAMGRRGRTLGPTEEAEIRAVFERTSGERSGAG